jgi:hypothetical protein
MVTIEESSVQRSVTLTNPPQHFARFCSAIDNGHKMTQKFLACANILKGKHEKPDTKPFVVESRLMPNSFFPW